MADKKLLSCTSDHEDIKSLYIFMWGELQPEEQMKKITAFTYSMIITLCKKHNAKFTIDFSRYNDEDYIQVEYPLPEVDLQKERNKVDDDLEF